MTPERWQQIEDVFQAVVDLAPEERILYLNQNYADDADLITEIKRLISDYEEAGDFIESPVWTDSFMLGATVRDKIGGAIDEEIKLDKGGMIGKRLGVYLLTKELGRGGMGAVYLAERADGEFRQRVALKVIKRGMDTDFIIRRFRNERQILASLDHQNIARLLDGGTTDDGLPFFVMEYIEGSPVYRYSDAKRLSVADRLRLFVKICHAVDYAHENLIIHRDIKPTNILVTGDGTPKLLDFGIAKILNPELAADSIDPTATAMRMMTPEYASPEQVRGEAVTKVSDIYSLGVLLYELLTGHRPYRLKNRALHEIARVICEEEPENLGAILTLEENFVPTSTNDEKTTLDAIFESRSANLESLKKELSGDLEKIVFKALRKNEAERYQSAKELAEDIQRYLDGEPVLAPAHYPAKPAFAQALSRTNPDEISVAVLPFKLFGAASGDTGDDYLCIGLADALITRLSNVRRFVVRPTSSVLRYGDRSTEPITAGAELAVNYLIDGNIRRVGTRLRVTVQLLNIQEGAARWAEKFDEEFTDVLTLEDTISEKIAEALMPQLTGDERDKLKKRGTNSAEAFEHYLRGRHYWNSFTEDGFAKAIVAYYQAVAFDPNYALAYAGIADYYNWLGIYGVLPSKECFQSAVENARKAIELDSDLGEAYASLAFAQHGGNFEWEESERNFLNALRLNPNVAETHVWYSIKLTTEGRFPEAVRHAERAVELDPQTPFNQHNLGWILYYARQFDRSLRQYQKTAEMFPGYPLAHYGLAWVLRYLGRFDEAVEHANRAQELMNETVFALHVQGQTFAAAGMREQTEVILEKLEKLSKKQFVSSYHTALIYAFLDEREKALELLEESGEKCEAWLVWLGVEAGFDNLRSDSRFKAVMGKTRNPILERDAIIAEKPNPTIAVLPFKVMNAASDQNTDDKFLGVGLADALITRLSNIRKFTVRPTSSVLRYDTENNPFSAGAQLGVDFLIDGNIRRVGASLRVTVQLLCIEQGATRWARRFDEKLTDFLALEDSISEQIVAELLPQLTGEDREQLKNRGTSNAPAYEAYLRGRYFWNKFTNESLPKAFEEFSEAARLDPNFAQAHVGIADFYVWLCIFGALPSTEAFPKAKEAAQKAIELNPELGEAYTTLGFVTTIYDWDWEKAEKFFRRALELSPNYAFAHEWYSNLLAAVGRYEEAVQESQRAVEIDPLSARGRVMNGWLHYQTRHFRRAVAEAEKAVEMAKDFPQGFLHLGNALDKAGRSEEAVAALQESQRLWEDSPLVKSVLCHALVNAGREPEAREILSEIAAETSANHYVKPYFVAVAYAAFEDKRDETFHWLEKAFADRNEWMIWLGTEPKFDSLREDARYFDLLERMNNPIVKLQKTESANLAAEGATTIAVLPLKTLQVGKTANMEDEFLGIGLADALVTRLSAVKRLIVRPTNSVIRSGKNTSDPFVIAREINAGFIVDGHVKRVGERIRVSVQLLNAAEQTAVWAKSFDEKYTDVLTLEDSVSEQIAEALLPQLTEDEKEKLQQRPTDNAKAFESYIRGRYHWNSFTEDGLQKSLLSYREALEYDPNFALAYAGIADYYNFLCIFGSKSPILSFPAAKEAAQKAIELNPNLAEAHVALGVAVLSYDWDFAEAEKLLKKGLELNPNYSVAHFWLAQLLSLKGDHDNALREMRRAEQLSPGIPSLLVIYAFTYRNARKFEKALEKIRQALSIQPNYYVAVQGFGWVVKWIKNYDEAEEITRKCVEQTRRFSLPLYAYGYVLAVRGKDKEARKIAKELEAVRAEKYIPAVYLALIYTELGEFDPAFEWLEKSFEEREFWAIWLPVDPRFDALKKDARYNDFINRIKPPFEEEDIHQSHIATRILPAIEAKPARKIEPAKEVVAEEKPSEKSPRKYWIAGASAVLLMGILAIFAFTFVKKRESGGYELTFGAPVTNQSQIIKPPANLKTIALMPFETDSDFENEESFAVGLSDAIGQKLRQVRELSMGLVFLKLNQKPSLEELARDYSVNYLLRGRLHIEGNRVQVDAELVGTADGKVLWLEKFDESADNFQNLQTAISERVLKALTIELSANERRQISKNYTEKPEAYQLYLVGRYQLSNRSAANLNKAIKTFEKARNLDPKFALAYAGLADAYALLNLYQIPPPPGAYDKAKQNAVKAIELDPNLAEAHASLGYVLFYHEHRRDEAVAELGRAIELNPAYSTAYHWLALMLSAMGRHDEAVRNIGRAIELEPKSAIIQTAAGLVYFYARKYDDALATANKVLENNEGFVPAYKTKRVVFEATGNFSGALSAYQNERIYSENTDEDDEGWMMISAQVQAVGGSRDEALANLKRTTESNFVKNNPTAFAYEIALAYALLGDAEPAVEWLKKAKEVNAYGFNFTRVDPRFDKIRNDLRFVELVGYQ